MKRIAEWFKNVALTFRREWQLMLADPGLLIFFLGLPLAYPIVYTLIYNPEVVREVSVAVVDDCRSEQSRELVRMVDAAPQVKVYGYASNMSDARRMWAEQDVYAVLHIPSDYSRKINRGEVADVTLYTDMSLLLRYRSLLSAMTNLQLQLASDITMTKAEITGIESTGVASLPVRSDSHFLGDTQQGFASFVIPGIVVLILQQSMILGAGLLGATQRERRRRNGGVDPKEVSQAGPCAAVLGKSLAYVVCYIPLTIYILHFVPEMFHLPHYGSPVDYLLFIFPLLFASAFLGQLSVALLKEREYVFLVVVFTSVVFLFLSGLTWPRYAMSQLWYWVGNLVPATWGVEGFIRINSNAATLGENSHPYIMMWLLAALYFVLASFSLRRLRRRGS